MDLQKAYDSVDWNALENILKEMSFPHKFIKWIMLTISIVSYCVLLLFARGDPISISLRMNDF